MKTLIAGGAGFLGVALAQRLVDAGHSVTVVDDFSSPSPTAVAAEATVVEASIVDLPDVGEAYDYIYNLASPASPPRYLLDPIGTLRTGAEGTRALLDLAERSDAVFLQASTSEIYGDPLEHPQRETYFGNVDIASPRACYDEAKRYGESLVHAYRRTGRVPETRVARIFNTYGPGMAPDDGRVVTNFVAHALRGEPLPVYGEGQQTRSFCYVDDLVDGLIRLASSSYTDPVNLGNPSEITIEQLADHVEGLLGAHGREYLPLPESDPVRRKPDIGVARSVLGWEPRTPLDVGLAATVSYLRDVLAVER